MARARNIDGPYEVDPFGPVVTARDVAEWPLQRAGHGDLVETPDGEIYLVHLCSRPLPDVRRSPLGRETALQKIEKTDDGWFRLAAGGARPQLRVPPPARSEHPLEPARQHHDFDASELDPVFQWLRTPRPEEFMSLSARPGHLRLRGMESLGSLYRQALIARRQEDFRYEAETRVEFEPQHFQQSAGLVCYYTPVSSTTCTSPRTRRSAGTWAS